MASKIVPQKAQTYSEEALEEDLLDAVRHLAVKIVYQKRLCFYFGEATLYSGVPLFLLLNIRGE